MENYVIGKAIILSLESLISRLDLPNNSVTNELSQKIQTYHNLHEEDLNAGLYENGLEIEKRQKELVDRIKSELNIDYKAL